MPLQFQCTLFKTMQKLGIFWENEFPFSCSRPSALISSLAPQSVSPVLFFASLCSTSTGCRLGGCSPDFRLLPVSLMPDTALLSAKSFESGSRVRLRLRMYSPLQWPTDCQSMMPLGTGRPRGKHWASLSHWEEKREEPVQPSSSSRNTTHTSPGLNWKEVDRK